MRIHLSNAEIMEELDHYVVGHTEAKKTLITMLSRSRLRAHQKYSKCMDDDFLVSPLKILLIGKSGTGKTHLLESLQKVVHFPLIRLDATQLNPAGASGGVKAEDLPKMIVKEVSQAIMDYPWLYRSSEEALDRTVIFVDEIDKLGVSFESSGNWSRHVQSNFLTTFDNKTAMAGISFVFAGAFGDITQDKRKDKHLGFHNPISKEEKKELIDLRVLQSGLIPEIVGRMNAICELDVFTKDDLYNILKNRVLPKKMMDLASLFIFDVLVPEERLREIAQEASESEQGVRYLQRALDREFLDVEFDADIEKIIYNDEY